MATHIEQNRSTQKAFRYVRGYPLIGNLPEFRNDRLGLLQRMAAEGDVCGMHIGPFPGILFNKPEHMHSILVEHAYDFDKGVGLHALVRPVFGNGLFLSEGDFHRHQSEYPSIPDM